MGNLISKLVHFMAYLPYVSLIILSLGLFLMLFSQHTFFQLFYNELHRLPVRLRNQLQSYTQDHVQNNPLLAADQHRLKKDLELSRLRIKGNPLTIPQVILLSFISAIVVMVVAFLLTTRYLSISPTSTSYSFMPLSSATAAPKQWFFNFPADLLAFILGFFIPRWYLFLNSVKARYKYQYEAPQALLRLSSAIRNHHNLETATKLAIPGFPNYTRWLFRQALLHWNKRHFTSFTEVFYWVARQTNHEAWQEVASYASTASSAGLTDLCGKISLLTTRSQELLGKRKEERRSITFQIGLAVFAFVILLVQLFVLIYRNPDMGQYLFTTSWGRILYALIYVAIFVEVAIFTWLHYQV